MNQKSQISLIANLVPGQITVQEQSMLLNLIESFYQSFEAYKTEIQSLKDEINRLKGEDGKPTISGKNQKEPSNEGKNISSEQERRQKQAPRKPKPIKYDKTRLIDVHKRVDISDKSKLPSDIEFKGYATSHFQNLVIKAELVEIERAIYYSASANKTYTAPLPEGYELGSDYSQELKGHISLFKFSLGLSSPKIGDFLRDHGIDISNGSISNIVLNNGEALKDERIAIHQAGLSTSSYVGTDTTSSRVNGVNQHSHVFGNDAYTAYFTKPNKDRQTVLDIIRAEQDRTYLFNERTFDLYEYLKIPIKVRTLLKSLITPQQYVMDKQTFINLIKPLLSDANYLKHEQKIAEGAYLSAYYTQNPLNILLADDAPQYKLLAILIALCWVHGGRNFKKLNPKIKYHQQILEDFLNQFWAFYKRLVDYKLKPDPNTAILLDADFDTLFSQKTGYKELDDRIVKTKANKHELLVVLKHPSVPLHNNASELAVRKEVRYRDVSFQTKTDKGTQAKDVFFTIIQTCKKLGINSYDYIMDRITKKFEMTPLNQLVANHNQLIFSLP
jgi:Transposase IS66 family